MQVRPLEEQGRLHTAHEAARTYGQGQAAMPELRPSLQVQNFRQEALAGARGPLPKERPHPPLLMRVQCSLEEQLQRPSEEAQG